MFNTQLQKQNINYTKYKKKRIECGWPQTCREKLPKKLPTVAHPKMVKIRTAKVSLTTWKNCPWKKRGKSFHPFENRVKNLISWTAQPPFQNLVAWSDAFDVSSWPKILTIPLWWKNVVNFRRRAETSVPTRFHELSHHCDF